MSEWTEEQKQQFLHDFRHFFISNEGTIQLSGSFTDDGPVYMINSKREIGWLSFVRVNKEWIYFNHNPACYTWKINSGSKYAPSTCYRFHRDIRKYFKKIVFLSDFPDKNEKAYKCYLRFLNKTGIRRFLPPEMIEHVVYFLKRVNMFSYGVCRK